MAETNPEIFSMASTYQFYHRILAALKQPGERDDAEHVLQAMTGKYHPPTNPREMEIFCTIPIKDAEELLRDYPGDIHDHELVRRHLVQKLPLELRKDAEEYFDYVLSQSSIGNDVIMAETIGRLEKLIPNKTGDSRNTLNELLNHLRNITQHKKQ